jgi:N-acetylneuraminic acid mutarotase
MDIRKNLTMITIFIVLTICLLPIYGQSRLNNTANTIENSADATSNVNLIDVNKETTQWEGMDSNELLNQVGEAAKKIAIGGANVLSNISGEIKKGLQ